MLKNLLLNPLKMNSKIKLQDEPVFLGRNSLFFQTLNQKGIYTVEDYINAETIVLPLGIKEIGATAFKHFNNLKYIIIPDGVTTIGLGAFSMLLELNDIIIPDTVTRIDPQVFFGTDNCNIYLGFSEGEVEGAPWGSEGTLHYDSDF